MQLPRWDRRRERALWRFYLRWLIAPFSGFKARWEAVAFWSGIVAILLGRALAENTGIPKDDWLWIVPLIAVTVVAAYRAILYPANAAIPEQPPAAKVRSEQPRSVTPPQRAAMIHRIKPLVDAWKAKDKNIFPQELVLGVRWSPMAADAEAYAHQLIEALGEAGFVIFEHRRMRLATEEVAEYPGPDLWIRKNKYWGDETPPIDEALRQGLLDAGIQSRFVWGSHLDAQMELIVPNP